MWTWSVKQGGALLTTSLAKLQTVVRQNGLGPKSGHGMKRKCACKAHQANAATIN